MEIPSSQISEQEPTGNTIEKILLFCGERLAFILFALFACAVLASGSIPKAFSQQEDPHFIEQETNWYQHNISFPVQKNTSSPDSFVVAQVVVTPTPTPTPAPISTTDSDVWEKLAQCETHGNWSSDTGNGYFGGLQFNQTAWESTGGTGNPALASKEEQINRGKILQARRGWGPWGSCAKKLSLN